VISIIDIFAVIILGYALYVGHKRGLINIAIDVVALGLTFLITSRYYKSVGNFLQKTLHIRSSWSDVGSWDNVLVWVLSFIMIYVLLKLIGILATRLLENTSLGDWNVWVGMAANGLKWLIVIWLVLVLIMHLPFSKLKLYTEKAVTYKAFQVTSAFIPVHDLLPKKLREI